MVTTRHDQPSIGQELMDLLTGEQVRLVEPERLAPADWVYLITHASMDLTLEFLRGLESIVQIMKERNLLGRVQVYYNSGMYSQVGVSSTELFLSCGAIEALPSLERWETDGEHFVPKSEKLLLLRRERHRYQKSTARFYVMTTKFKLVKNGPTIYHLQASDPHFMEAELVKVFESKGGDAWKLGQSILRLFAVVQKMTEEDLQDRLELARDSYNNLRDYAERVGLQFND